MQADSHGSLPKLEACFSVMLRKKVMSYEFGGRIGAQCVESHKKSLKHLKYFGKFGWILKIKCICQPQE